MKQELSKNKNIHPAYSYIILECTRLKQDGYFLLFYIFMYFSPQFRYPGCIG